MSAVVVFIIFAICLVIAIPISISLGIVAVLPGAFDASFTASAGYVIRSMVGDQVRFHNRENHRSDRKASFRNRTIFTVKQTVKT